MYLSREAVNRVCTAGFTLFAFIKFYFEILILLVLLLVLSRYLNMWTSIPEHIYPHLSKAMLLFETNGGINKQCLQWVPYMPETIVHDIPLLVYVTSRKA